MTNKKNKNWVFQFDPTQLPAKTFYNKKLEIQKINADNEHLLKRITQCKSSYQTKGRKLSPKPRGRENIQEKEKTNDKKEKDDMNFEDLIGDNINSFEMEEGKYFIIF
jgi:hypothetical protein